MGGKSEVQREQSRHPTPRAKPEQEAEVGATALPAVRHICRRFPRSLGTGLFQAPFHMEFALCGREILAWGDSLFLEVEGRESVWGSALQHQAQACPADAACCRPSCSPAALSLLRDITVAKLSSAKPPASAHLLGSQLDGCETLGRVVADTVDKGGHWVENDVLCGLDEFNRFLGWHFSKVQPFPDGLVPVQDGWHPRGQDSQRQSPVPIWQSEVAKARLVSPQGARCSGGKQGENQSSGMLFCKTERAFALPR